MPKYKSRIPSPQQRSREFLHRADTGVTATYFEQPPEPIPKRQRGERVDAPTAEMRGPAPTDWGKVGVWVTIGIFLIGMLVTVVWNYADMVNTIKNISTDVDNLKRQADDLFKSSVDASMRLSNLESRAQLEASPLPATNVPSSSAPKRR